MTLPATTAGLVLPLPHSHRWRVLRASLSRVLAKSAPQPASTSTVLLRASFDSIGCLRLRPTFRDITVFPLQTSTVYRK